MGFPNDNYKFDTKDARKIITALPEQIKEASKILPDIPLTKKYSKVFIAGMGGSGIAADLLASLMRIEGKLPVSVIKDYDLPKGIDSDSLFIAITYSGNTEETLSAYKLATRTGAQMLTVSSGGKLQELATLNKHSHIKVPGGYQPRMALAYLLIPLIKLFERNKSLPAHDFEELSQTIRKQKEDPAIELSKKIYKKIPVIYTDDKFYPVAYRWKTQFNENAKTPAFSHAISELNHNEMLSWTNKTAEYHVIILTMEKYHRRIYKRIDLTKDILQKKGVPVTEINIKGDPLKAIFTSIYLGDMTSYYLALRYETDPTPVELIEKFKKDMGPFLI